MRLSEPQQRPITSRKWGLLGNKGLPVQVSSCDVIVPKEGTWGPGRGLAASCARTSPAQTPGACVALGLPLRPSSTAQLWCWSVQHPGHCLPHCLPITSNHRSWGPSSLLPSPSAPSPDPLLCPDGSAPKQESLHRSEGVPCPTAGTARPYPVAWIRSARRPHPEHISTPSASLHAHCHPAHVRSFQLGSCLLPVRSERTSFGARRVLSLPCS